MVCVCVCVYVCMYICIFVCMHVNVCVCVCLCMHICIFVRMHAVMYVCKEHSARGTSCRSPVPSKRRAVVSENYNRKICKMM
jgi:hypothetical protein